MPLTAVIVGITHWHAPRYAHFLAARGVRLAGASDAHPQAGAAAAAKHKVDFFPDTAQLLDRTKPDIAILLPRHDLAAREIATVAERRIPMLIEKPMGRNAAEAAASAAAVRRAGVFASVCFPNRHLAIWDAYRKLVAEDALGTVMHAHFRTINGPPSRYLDYGVPWMLDAAISGGGVLRNLGIHGADAIAMLAKGRPLSLVGGHTSNIGYGGATEDFAAGIFATDDGFVATMEAGYTYANMQEGGDYEWRIAARGAYLHECNGRLRIHKRGGALEERAVTTPHLAYGLMVNAALDAFESGAPPPSNVDDCVRAVQLQDMIYKAADKT